MITSVMHASAMMPSISNGNGGRMSAPPTTPTMAMIYPLAVGDSALSALASRSDLLCNLSISTPLPPLLPLLALSLLAFVRHHA